MPNIDYLRWKLQYCLLFCGGNTVCSPPIVAIPHSNNPLILLDILSVEHSSLVSSDIYQIRFVFYFGQFFPVSISFSIPLRSVFEIRLKSKASSRPSDCSHTHWNEHGARFTWYAAFEFTPPLNGNVFFGRFPLYNAWRYARVYVKPACGVYRCWNVLTVIFFIFSIPTILIKCRPTNWRTST